MDQQEFWDRAVLNAVQAGQTAVQAVKQADELAKHRLNRLETVPEGYKVVLSDAGPKRIKVIRSLRELRDLGLADAKNLTENLPKIIFENVHLGRAVKVRHQLCEDGASVQIVPIYQTPDQATQDFLTHLDTVDD